MKISGIVIIDRLYIALLAILVALAASWFWQNWYRLGSGYAWNTLQIRCEQERQGVLIGENCFRKDALIWSAKDAPR